MRALTLFVLIALAATATNAEQRIRYDNQQVLRVTVPKTVEAVTHYSELVDKLHSIGVKQWSGHDLMVHTEQLNFVEAVLTEAGFQFETVIDNVQILIDRELEHRHTVRLHENFNNLQLTADNYFADYRSYDEINKYMESLVQQYPTLIQRQNIGQTYQGNPMYAYTVNGTGGSENKTGIFFECGIHSREWITQTTCVYMLTQLVTQYGKDAHITQLVDSLTWYIVPVVNVDGFLYTWSTDRMWRKTRTPNKGSSCIGVDPNRNWDSHHCEVGASTDPCSDSYCGPSPFSEPCVKHISEFILQHPNINVFIDFHSYSQLWMGPYGYTASLPKDAAVQDTFGQLAVHAIANQSGYQYAEGPIYTTIYPASGSSADWGYDTAHVKFSYGVELRDQGQYGFVLPAEQIVPTGKEIFAAALAMADFLLTNPEPVKPIRTQPYTAKA